MSCEFHPDQFIHNPIFSNYSIDHHDDHTDRSNHIYDHSYPDDPIASPDKS